LCAGSRRFQGAARVYARQLGTEFRPGVQVRQRVDALSRVCGSRTARLRRCLALQRALDRLCAKRFWP